MTARHIVFDTDPVLITGKGTIALDGEHIDMTLQGQPKKFRILSVHAPITIKGTFDKPDIGVDAAKALPQGGLAAALAFPIAAGSNPALRESWLSQGHELRIRGGRGQSQRHADDQEGEGGDAPLAPTGSLGGS